MRLALAFCCLSIAFAQTPAARHALERPGLHHADIRGRFVTPEGKPVAGVRVFLGAEHWTHLPLAETVSGADGRFLLADVSTETSTSLGWTPPEGWQSGRTAVVPDGDIRLVPETVIRVVTAEKDLSIVLTDAGGRGPRIVARRAGTGKWLVLRDIPFTEGVWDVSNYPRGEQFGGTFRVEPGRRDQLLLLTVDRTEKKVIVSEVLAPVEALDQERMARGRVLAPDGTPAAGALVSVGGEFMGTNPKQFMVADGKGEFALRYRGAECKLAWAELNGVASKYEGEVKCGEEARELRLEDGVRVAPWESGRTLSWWHPKLGWQPFVTGSAWAPQEKRYRKPAYRLEAPGRMPLAARGKAEFADGAGVRSLRVTGGGKALAGARVDLEWIEQVTGDARVPLATYRTGADGGLRLEGAAAQLVEAFVYADGYEPRRAIWTVGTPLALALTARDGRVRFPRMARGETAIVRYVGTGASRGVTGPDVALGAGRYEGALLGANGVTTGVARLDWAAGEMRDVMPVRDGMPRLTVRHPAGWRVSVSRDAGASMPVGFAIYSVMGGGQAEVEARAVVELIGDGETVFRLPGTGRFHVRAGAWWREVDVAGEMVLTLPRETAVLTGTMRSFPAGTEVSHHGIATPRMQVIADDPEGWSVTVPFPERVGVDGFRVPGLPVGNYHVFQHLIGTRATFGKTEYTVPTDAWGGIPVRLEAGKTAVLRDFLEYPYGPLTVRVEGALTGRVRVRDRMAEAWGWVASGPTTLRDATQPIPAPAAARIVNGVAELGAVRPGLLELEVEMDDGRRFPFRAVVKAGEALRLAVGR